MNFALILAAVLFVTPNAEPVWHSAFPADIASAPREAREACGWYNLMETPPSAPTGFYARPSGYERTEDGYRRLYTIEPLPPVVRRYSKLRLITAAKTAGKWDSLKAFVRQADLEDEWLACQFFEDGNAQFVAGTNAVVTSGIATEAEVRAMLDAAVDPDL